MAQVMLSLASNPYNPFTQYNEWKRFDSSEGYDTAGFLARLVQSSEVLSEPDQELAVEQAVDSVLLNQPLRGMYKKIYEDGTEVLVI